MIKHRVKVGIITPPRGKAALVPLRNLVRVLSELPITERIVLITGGEVAAAIGPEVANLRKITFYNINYETFSDTMKILRNILMQIEISKIVLGRSNRRIGLWMFFLDGESLVLPILLLKLVRRATVVVILTASASRFSEAKRSVLTLLTRDLSLIGLKLVDYIVIYTRILIDAWNLQQFRNKILIAHEHYVDLNLFREIKPIHRRRNVVGYIGRLSPEKGIMNFLESAYLVLQEGLDIEFLIIGDGPLKRYVQDFIISRNLYDKIKFIGWIAHQDLPLYMNDLKLVVIPSYSEGLPNVLLECMACGTPVLASSVGAIPEIIEDGRNGYLIECNNPRTIAEKIIEILRDEGSLINVSRNCQNYIREEFSFAKTVEIWDRLLRELLCLDDAESEEAYQEG